MLRKSLRASPLPLPCIPRQSARNRRWGGFTRGLLHVNCPGCGSSQNGVNRTIDGRKDVIRARRCTACGGSWRTIERPERASFEVLLGAHVTGVKPTGQNGSTAKPLARGEGGVSAFAVPEQPSLLRSGSDPAASQPSGARARRGRGDAAEYPVEFESIWDGCLPHRGVKFKAFKAWVKLKPNSTLILPAYAAWLKTDQWRRGIIPYLSTWLNGRAWETAPEESELAAPRTGFQSVQPRGFTPWSLK